MVHQDKLIRHKEEGCVQRTVTCSNSGCYLKIPEIKREHHERFECRRAIVYCRLGCGNTMFAEKREFHESTICEYRFVSCPLCEEQVREKDKMGHMIHECVRRTV